MFPHHIKLPNSERLYRSRTALLRHLSLAMEQPNTVVQDCCRSHARETQGDADRMAITLRLPEVSVDNF